jgi:hypothetical protein
MEDRKFKRIDKDFKEGEMLKSPHDKLEGNITRSNEEIDRKWDQGDTKFSEDSKDVNLGAKPDIPGDVKDTTNFVNSRATREGR